MKELFYPRRVKDFSADVHTYIVGPHLPAAPPLSDQMQIACVGSCFAQEIAKSLGATGKPVLPLFLSERLNTSFALAHTFAHALDQTPFPEGFLPGNITAVQDEGLAKANAYIITLGLSLCWYERASGTMVAAVKEAHSAQGLAEAFDAYELRQTSVAENVEQVARIIDAIRRHKPEAPIVLTLSPVPLLTVTSGSPISGNAVSKATLRIAIDEIMRRNLPGVYYWPSYEIVEWTGKHVGLVWGQNGSDQRHLSPDFIDVITKRFISAYFPT